MDGEEFKGVVLRTARADGLVMSRVPKPTRDKFIQLANSEFAGDYGLTLKSLWDNYELFLFFINNFNIKLDHIINLISSSKNEESHVEEKLKLLDGRKVGKGGKIHE